MEIILNETYDEDNNNLVEELAPGKIVQSVKIPFGGDLSVFPENTIIRIKTT
jgi:putative protease